ncbi:hypothetical protein BS17DRAFT_770497 [Gyrodon lividus]|nr:hypothetical protein BS17DRAFT_770497 [Gyrodon lividus]
MFKTKKELVLCEAVKEQGVLHWDCSMNNAMIEDNEDGSHGLLLDWEFSVQITKLGRYKLGGMGTLPFLLINLLHQLQKVVKASKLSTSICKSASLTHMFINEPIEVKHTYVDDIEALFYVFIWILVLHDGPLGHECQVSHEDTMLGSWRKEAANNLNTAKNAKFTFLIANTSDLSS